MSDDDQDNTTSHPILCGLCKAPVGSKEGADGETLYGCADCDNWDTKDEVIRIAGEYVTDQAQLDLNRSMSDIAKGSSVMSFSGQTESTKEFRFVTDGPF
ncbi:hypothetical protein [Salipiger mucosus]|uniref:hypothetical protein n=1 Tax=Salipiger mucosus TaxID=263378 RepID=UPI00037E7AAF|nr:hypothetical protein [Salipiger mucosus]